MVGEPFEWHNRTASTSSAGPDRPHYGSVAAGVGAAVLADGTTPQSMHVGPSEARHAPRAPEVDPGRAEDNTRWTTALTEEGPAREAAADALYAYLLRAARSELAARSSTSRLSGPERDDVAHQAAADALVSVIRRIPDFRGESRFTTWARSFVTFEVRVKVRQHNRRSVSQPLVDEEWDRVFSSPAHGPEAEVEAFELKQAVESAVATALTPRQRAVFLGIVVHGASIEQLAAQLGSNRNAVYQLMFHARQNLRRHLTQGGFMLGVPSP